MTNQNNINANKQQEIIVNGQYVKDISFENPGAPTLFSQKKQPQINVSLDVQGSDLKKNIYEITLSIQVNAEIEKKKLFIADLKYAGIFTINCDDNELEKIILVYCPNLLFPFARRIMADITRDGGYPPLMLEPFDFLSLYIKNKEQKDSKQKSNKETEKV